MKKISYVFAVALFSFLAACQPDQQPLNKKNVQAAKAAAAAETISFTENAEIDNIKKRLELTSNPGLTGFVVLLNETGQPVMYTGVVGKLTSGSKRLTKPFQYSRRECDRSYCDHQEEAPSDEGTYGHSSPYIYFWSSNGQYIQWNGKYLYSDKPIRLRVEPLVITEMK